MQITKNDFIIYLNCEKSFWLSKKDSEHYPKDVLTDFEKKLRDDWQEVRSYFEKYFKAKGNDSINFQKTFQATGGLIAKTHGFEINIEGESCLYEVKSSKEVNNDSKHNHLNHACFQMIVAERSDQKIDKVVIVHLNGDYVRNGAIRPDELLVFEDVTNDVRAIEQEMSAKIDKALLYLSKSEIDINGCDCIYKTKSNHCNAFKYFNPHIPEQSIYKLPNLRSGKKLNKLVENSVFALRDVTDEYDLKPPQKKLVLAAQTDTPQVDKAAIAVILDTYNFPLYFFDYETFPSAVPIIDGLCPHQHLPVQYSLHILQEDGTLTHTEFLQDTARLPLNLIEQMESDFGGEGSVVVWHYIFERDRNKEMAKMFPDKADFLNDINDRLIDLKVAFKKDYVDVRFDGSASLKKVLPIVCPHLGYDDLAVQDGTSAIDIWEKMISSNPEEANELASNLLEYCKLDTFAMVEIYRFLKLLP